MQTTCNAMLVLLTAAATGLATSGRAQGSLTPPGAPAPGMKTLAQIEPRTAITNAPYTITVPGSYYLTTNLAGTVTIAAHNVTLDLMGFAIAPALGNALGLSGGTRTNVAIRNGSLSAPTGNGADFSTAAGARGLIEGIRISNCQNYGLVLGNGFVVRDCEIYGTGLAGIKGNGAIEVRNCLLQGNAAGLELAAGSRAVGNTVVDNTGDGLKLTGAGSYVADNVVKGNADNYDLAADNQLNLLICQLPESLDWPCSAKLVGTLRCSTTNTDGITVTADGVTIDLAGHALIGPGPTSGHGIFQSVSRRNLTVKNGKLTNWHGTAKAGIWAGSSALLSGLHASTNYYGIYTGASSTIRDCSAYDNGVTGINAGSGSTIGGCAAEGNGLTGIAAGYGSAIGDCTAYGNQLIGISADTGCTIRDCAAYGNIQGFYTAYGCTVRDCAASYNTGTGFSASSGATFSGCAALNNTGDGINVDFDNRVVNCVCQGNGYNGDGAGIHALTGDNHIEGNTVTDNDRGIDVDAAGNFIVRNTASGNATNWVVAAGNVCLVVQATTAGAISGNAGGTAPGSTDPNANFTY